MTRWEAFLKVLGLHLLVLAVLVLVPMLKSCEWLKKEPEVITVDLASLPPLPDLPEEEDPEEDPEEEEAFSRATPVPAPTPTPPPRPTATPRPEATPVPTATPRPQPTPTPAWQAASIEEIRKRIQQNNQNPDIPPAPTMSPEQLRALLEAGVPAGGSGGGTVTGNPGAGVNFGGVEAAVQSRLDSAWKQPIHLSAASGLYAVGEVIVQRNGNIGSSRIIRPSGNAEFDSSVQQALDAVRFAKPLPDDYSGSAYSIKTTFRLTQ